MKKEKSIESLKQTLNAQNAVKAGWSAEQGRNLPIFKGDVLKLTGETGIVSANVFYPNGVGVPSHKSTNYPAFKTDAQPLSFTQICRNRNGLSLSGTREEMLNAFVDKFTDEGITLKVSDVKTRTAVYDGTESTSNYLFFEVVG